ncbi:MULTISPECIES: Zn-ribbon domain-containing OB-fold protein [unclassified Pseudofrankia]|uniref:Zn-ribbon domain-containing OB-fold protein n=1 Tax=unclassified Pseudofrankia TaxID=2994372 RepID=UPI0008DAA00E|nr:MULTISPECIES: OB-fold domain-containing protein [unclassified Pseudofrankia]MDT3445637.1 OB-fold domain-containing protein [Pseudofrankia sp. BMG5.37]OHV63518.1 hypothetical protein BCD48_37975 [Pseudofrankia sp. BMG5.36]
MPRQIPVVEYLALGDDPHLTSHACRSCGALYFDRRNACAKCFATDFDTTHLANRGRVRAFTIVGRIKRPFVSVVVDLEGGGVVKANLLGVDDPDAITPGMPVELATFVAGTDDEGTEAIAFGYRPRSDREAQPA